MRDQHRSSTDGHRQRNRRREMIPSVRRSAQLQLGLRADVTIDHRFDDEAAVRRLLHLHHFHFRRPVTSIVRLQRTLDAGSRRFRICLRLHGTIRSGSSSRRRYAVDSYAILLARRKERQGNHQKTFRHQMRPDDLSLSLLSSGQVLF